MILLLLTSALALSFVPLKSNALSAITVTIGTVTYDPTTSKLTVPVTASAAVTAGNAFELAIFEAATGTEMIGAEVDIEDKLDGTENNAEATLDLATVKADLAAIYIDVIETDATDSTTRSMLAGGTRKEVTFRKVESFAYAVKDADKVTVTFTLDGEVTGATFEIPSGPLTLTKGTGNEYSADVLITELVSETPLVGYFKGTNLATSSLPLTVPAPLPDPVLGLLNAEKAKCVLTDVPTDAVVKIKSGADAAKTITKPAGKDYYPIEYADLEEECKIYYANAEGTKISKEATIALLPAFTAPTGAVWTLATDPTDKTPLLKVTFGATPVPNRKLVLVQEEGEPVLVDVSAEDDTVIPSDKLVGTDGYYIVTDEDDEVPKSLPLALTKAAFTTTPAAAADRKIKSTVVMTAGYYAAKPTGVLLIEEKATDLELYKYYPLVWDTTTAGKATFEVDVDEWKTVVVKDVCSFVVGNYDEDDLESVVDLSADPTVIIPKKDPATSVTVGPAFTYNPATAALTVPVKSAATVTSSTSAFTLAVFDLAAAGEELVGRVNVKTLLDGTDGKTATVTINLANMPVDKNAIYIDILEEPTGRGEFSIATGGDRVAATFNGKAADIVTAKEGDAAVKFTFTLDAALTTDIADTKFVFNAVGKDVVVVDAAAKKYSVTIAIADLLAAESTVGHFKGDSLATCSLPISLFTVTPGVTLKHTNATHAEATFSNAPVAEGTKIMIKSGETTEELTKEDSKYQIAYTKLANAVIYYTKADVLDSNKYAISLPAFTAPTTIEWIAEEEEPAESNDAVITHTVKFTFAAGVANRKLYVTATPARAAIDLSTVATETTPAKLVGTAGYYIVVEGTVPKTLPLDFEEAAFTQTPGPVAEKKVPVAVAITPGLLKAEPAGLLVYATEETDKTKMKFYPFTWDTTEGAVNKASASVEVDDFKTITDKDIESYVAPDYSEAIPDTRVLLSEKAVVIAKKEPVEPEPKDEGAFGQMVSLMAVVVSLFVLAL